MENDCAPRGLWVCDETVLRTPQEHPDPPENYDLTPEVRLVPNE